MGSYLQVNAEVLENLKKIVGTENVLYKEKIAEKYTHDAWIPSEKFYPEVVVFPNDAVEVSKIVQLANHYHFPLIPRGGGTGLSGGVIPVLGGVVVDLMHMNRIIKINSKGRYMVTEPSVKTLEIQKKAAEHGLLYAGDPSSDDCFIGGNVATNAGGNRAVKYGVTADLVYALEVVTPKGQIVHLGARLKKNSTGYNLVKLMSGSEGTLGIITQITLKLVPLKPVLATTAAFLPQFKTAAEVVSEILADEYIDPISLEIIDKKTIGELSRYHEKWSFFENGGDCLILQVEARSEEESEFKKKRFEEFIKAAGGRCFFPDPVEIWEARRGFGKAIEAENSVLGIEDIVVPVEDLADFSEELYYIAEESGLDVRIAGHAGDGNIHIQIVSAGLAKEKWAEHLHDFSTKLHQAVYQRGGRLSGEHGIGLKRKNYFMNLADPAEVELMKDIKRALDPNGILNPGKIFDIDKGVVTDGY